MGNANTWSQSHKVTDADSPVQRQCRKYPPDDENRERDNGRRGYDYD